MPSMKLNDSAVVENFSKLNWSCETDRGKHSELLRNLPRSTEVNLLKPPSCTYCNLDCLNMFRFVSISEKSRGWSVSSGTLDKCKACDKTVYFVDLLSVDGTPYHKSCFKCSHCKGTLAMSSYSSMDGTLYCKPHFEQLFKESGNFSKNFHTSKPERENSITKTPNKLSSMFSGTQDKCAACHKTVYPFEKITMEGESYHRPCFKCAHGGCPLTHSSYAALDGILYCKHHFAQLFLEKGNYNHVLEAAKIKSGVAPVESEGEQAEGASEEKAAEEPPPENTDDDQKPPEDS